MNAWLMRSDARRLPLLDETIDCIVTSPPYWGLRDYGVKGQIGLEADPAAYVSEIVAVMREARRVLRPTGTLWLNLGDCYHSGDRGGYRLDEHRWEKSEMQAKRADRGGSGIPCAPNRLPQAGLKDKDLVGIPWRVALALQADGWWLRSDIVWHKPNPMPESILDRPTRSHEYIFLLSKSARYHYDADAIREPHTWNGQNRYTDPAGHKTSQSLGPGLPPHTSLHLQNRGFDTRGAVPGQRARRSKTAGPGPHAGGRRQAPEPGEPNAFHPNGRNARSVWTVPTQPYPEAHFATFPQEIARRCILAGCPKGGIVLDPFAGSGTTGRVAIQEGRYAVLCDLAYQGLAAARIAGVQRPLVEVGP